MFCYLDKECYRLYRVWYLKMLITDRRTALTPMSADTCMRATSATWISFCQNGRTSGPKGRTYPGICVWQCTSPSATIAHRSEGISFGMGSINTTPLITNKLMLEEIVDLADKLHTLISQLPKKYEKALRCMKDVCGTIQNAQVAYLEVIESLSDGNVLKDVLDSTRREMKDAHEEVTRLSPTVNTKFTDKLKIAFKSFKNCQDVESMILKLKDRVDESLVLITILARNRPDPTNKRPVNAATGHTHQSSVQPDAQITIALSDCEPFYSPQLTASMPWNLESIPMEDLFKAYIRSQLTRLENSLKSASFRGFENPPDTIDLPPFRGSWFLERSPSTAIHLRREALMTIFGIISLLESPEHSWIHSVNISLSHLATYLVDLKLDEDAISVNVLSVDLCTAVSTLYPNSSASDHLIAALTNLSITYLNKGDISSSHNTSHRAAEAINSRISNSSGSDGVILPVLVAQHLSVEAMNEHDSATYVALNAVEASVKKMEDLLGIKSKCKNFIPINILEDTEFSNAIIALMQNNALHDLLFAYACLLSHLSQIQHDNCLPVDASLTAKQTLEILCHLLNVYPTSSKILDLRSTNFLKFFDTPEILNPDAIDTVPECTEVNATNLPILQLLPSLNPRSSQTTLNTASFVSIRRKER